MNNEIVYVCNSVNNKNIRANELKILRKVEEKLCFEFGESESNIKLRFYRSIEDLNKDYETVQKIKEKLENKEIKDKEEPVLKDIETENQLEEEIEEEKLFKEYKNKSNYRKRKLF